MRLGLSSYAYRWSIAVKGYRPAKPLTTKEFILKALNHGVDGVQICDHLDFVTLSDRSLQEVRQLAETRGIYIETGAGNTDLDHLHRLIAVSEKLGSRLLRVVPEIHRDCSKHGLSYITENIHRCLNAAKEAGVRIALENHAQITSDELLSVVKSLGDSYVGICLDTMNSIVLMEKPIETAQRLAPFAITVHFKDFKIEPNPRGHRIIGVPLGEGIVDFGRVLEIIKDAGVDPNINIELFVDRKEGEEATFRWEEQCVQKSVRYARGELAL